MTVQAAVDLEALMWEEVDDIGQLLHELADPEWDEPSLCEGWRVRDVVGHMAYGHTTRLPTIAREVVRYRGDMSRGSFELSRRMADSLSTDELRSLWDRELVGNRARRGIARTIRPAEGFLDHLVHHQDIRRPLGRHRSVPPHRLVAALDVLPRIKSSLFATRPVVEGLTFVATDVGHDIGSGPEVTGPAEALIMAAAGRTVALAELDGPGLSTLRDRTTAG